MKLLLVGPGAVGTYFAGRLAADGAAVDVVARSEAEHVRAHGYRIKSIAGDFQWRPRQVFSDAAESRNGSYDYVLLCSKVLPEIDFRSMLSGALAPHCPLALIQNGIDIEPPLRAAFPDNEIISSIAYIGVSRIGPGALEHVGAGRLKTGSFPSGVSPAAQALVDAFNHAHVPCELSDDIVRDRWGKLLWNLPFNPVSVLAGGLETDAMMDRAELEKLCADLMAEVADIAEAEGKPTVRDGISFNLEFTRDFPPYKPSMLLDYEAGRPMEVEAIVGNALRLARKHRINVPRTECCYALLKSLDRINRAKKLAK